MKAAERFPEARTISCTRSGDVAAVFPLPLLYYIERKPGETLSPRRDAVGLGALVKESLLGACDCIETNASTVLPLGSFPSISTNNHCSIHSMGPVRTTTSHLLP